MNEFMSSESPDFDQIARLCLNHGGAWRGLQPTVDLIAEQLCLVWNARGAADIAANPKFLDFDQIARKLLSAVLLAEDSRKESIIAAQLRLIWNAGFEAGGQHETFVKHLKDENNAAHQALDRHQAPTTTQVPSHNLDGGPQPVTIGLASRIHAVVEQWKANSRENKQIAEGLIRERDELLQLVRQVMQFVAAEETTAYPIGRSDWIDAARAAIAKVEAR